MKCADDAFSVILGVGDEDAKMISIFVVGLGIIHTCTALRYKSAIIATR